MPAVSAHQAADTHGLTWRAQLRSALGVLLSQLPWHDSVNQPLPAYYAEWLGHWQSGADVSQIIGKQQTPC